MGVASDREFFFLFYCDELVPRLLAVGIFPQAAQTIRGNFENCREGRGLYFNSRSFFVAVYDPASILYK
jgi:hypothetical protein